MLGQVCLGYAEFFLDLGDRVLAFAQDVEQAQASRIRESFTYVRLPLKNLIILALAIFLRHLQPPRQPHQLHGFITYTIQQLTNQTPTKLWPLDGGPHPFLPSPVATSCTEIAGIAQTREGCIVPA